MPSALAALLAPLAPTGSGSATAAAAAPAVGAGPVVEEGTAVPWLVFVLVAVGLLAAGGALLAFALRKGRAAVEERCSGCGKVLLPEWSRCLFCSTPRGARKAALEVLSGPLHGQTIPLEAEVTTIGSASGSTLQLSDSGVSRKHAGIRKTDGGFELADLGSTNGVYVNGEKVARRKLQQNDIIRVGATEMVFKG